LEAKGTLN